MFQNLSGDLTPAQIVKQLHRYMATLAPGLAQLVQVYDDVMAGRRDFLTNAEFAADVGRVVTHFRIPDEG